MGKVMSLGGEQGKSRNPLSVKTCDQLPFIRVKGTGDLGAMDIF